MSGFGNSSGSGNLSGAVALEVCDWLREKAWIVSEITNSVITGATQNSSDFSALVMLMVKMSVPALVLKRVLTDGAFTILAVKDKIKLDFRLASVDRIRQKIVSVK